MGTKTERDFPFDRKLLTCSLDDRLAYYAKYKAEHPRLNDIVDKITSAVLYPNDKNFLLMVGAPRAGKTTVQHHIVGRLLTAFSSLIAKDPGAIPIIWIESDAYPSSYNWKDHWTICLKALKEPLIEHKSLQHDGSRYVTGGQRFTEDEGGAAIPVRHSYHSTARERHLRVLINDEAHHMRKAPTKTRIIEHAEILKTDASKTKAVFLLCGTYDLLDLANLNGQLGCRTEIVHFSRYLLSNAEDVEAFSRVAVTLIEHMPVKSVPDINDYLDYLYRISLGLVGLLKMWFYETLREVLVKNRKELTLDDLKRHEPPVDVRLAVADEIRRGEQKLNQNQSKEKRIRDFLGLKEEDNKETVRRQSEDAGEPTSNNEKSATSKKNGKGSHKPGDRKPTRDPVGEGRKRNAA